MNHYLVRDDLWCINQEDMSHTATKHYEGLFTQGSGYLHLRGSYEEGLAAAPQDEQYMRMPANVTVEVARNPRSKAGTYLPGITGQHPLLHEEIVNLPNPLCVQLSVGNETLDIDTSDIANHQRCLDLRDGVLYRELDWHTKLGSVQLGFSRFICRHLPSLVVQRFVLTAQQPMTLRLQALIDANVTTNGYNHFTERTHQSGDGWFGVAVRTDSNDTVQMVSCLAGVPSDLEDNQATATLVLLPDQPVELYRLTLVASSRDAAGLPSPSALATQLLSVAGQRDQLYHAHAKAWAGMWQRGSLTIKGDPKAQQAINISLYHLLRASNPDDSRVAICAKGFAGEAYFGHFFWDTEVYMMPYFLYTQPELARNLLQFRLRTLAGAQRNAAAYGYQGAKYPWESSVSGEEQCPNWQYCDHEIHINADVAHGIWHYYKATGDTALLSEAMPALAEIARYWLSRCYIDKQGKAHVNGVMGPDEYICMSNDNAYTNHMASRSLNIAIEAAGILHSSLLGSAELTAMRHLADTLVIHRNSDGIILQCKGFEEMYEDPDFAAIWGDRKCHFGAAVSQERNYRTKALKQADVLMLPYLFPDIMSDDELARTYDYYFPITTHDSSLSYIVHSILQARLGNSEDAYSLFTRSMLLDWEGGAAEGIHIANCGGLWQGVIMGFCGMRWGYTTDELCFTPHLPAHWESVTFPIAWQGGVANVVVTHAGATIDSTPSQG